MKNINYKNKPLLIITLGSLLIIGMTGCKKLVDVKAPVTSTNAPAVYATDATAIASLTGIYATMGQNIYWGFPTGVNSISVKAGLSADEFTLYNGVTNISLVDYYKNALTANGISPQGSEYWTELYACIFYCNAAIEGLNNAQYLTPTVKKQLLGEAKFLRGFCYFYLVNFFGDVPLALTTDFKVNTALGRTHADQVYQQIVSDLLNAEGLLSDDFLDGQLQQYAGSTPERLRPTKWAATALLARVYLYQQDYVKAEAQSTQVINNAALFTLEDLNNTFLKNSREAIWQLQPVNAGRNTEDAFAFIIPDTGPSNVIGTDGSPCYLSPQLLEAFEANDERKNIWVNHVTVGATTYYYPYKYKLTTQMPVNEYLMVLRLSEQYLVRAEALAWQGKLNEAAADADVVRERAGLSAIAYTSKEDLLSKIFHERQVELFSEWGHRWLDMKRTGTVNDIMAKVTPQKGGSWNTNWQLYPVPLDDVLKDPRLTQNPGY
jgi:hypothetical protein